VILIDTNLLLYAHVSGYAEHRKAKSWLVEQLGGATPVGLPWQCLLGFVRLLSNPKIYSRATPIPEAWRQVREWLTLDNVWIPQPTERHIDILGELLPLVGRNFNLVSDAHLAAIAIEHGLTLCSADTDFARFPKLRWVNPLAPSA
jgi:uncharacterized protein